MSYYPDPELTLQGGVAICRQIQSQIRDCIASGQLVPGEQLPSVRAMAVELAVNPSAVSKAYRELEDDGFLTSEEGSGTFIAPQPSNRLEPAASRAAFESLCWEFLNQAARYGFSSADVLEQIEAFTQPNCCHADTA